MGQAIKVIYDVRLNLKEIKDGRLTVEVDDEREPKFNEIVVTSASRFVRNIAIIETVRL